MHVLLETERLILRQLTEHDLDDLVELNSDPEVMRYISGGAPESRESLRDDFLPHVLTYYDGQDGFGFWAATEKATGAFLGWFHFRANSRATRADGSTREGVELGYRLRRSAWGKGYGTEGSRALIRLGFTKLGVERVYAETMTINTASRRVMEKAGLHYNGAFRDDYPMVIPGDEFGDVEYVLTRAQWQADSGSGP